MNNVSEHYESTTTRRYWRRTHTPKGWWPYGFLLLLGLLLLWLIGALVFIPAIERQIENDVRERLANYEVVSVEVAGEDVRAVVRAPEAERDGIEGIIGATRCSTWAGPLVCPWHVDLELALPADLPAQPAEPIPAARLHDFQFVRVGDDITLTGEVPSAEVRGALAAAAAERFAVVDDQMSVSDELSDARDSAAAATALGLLADVERGEASWRDGALSLSALVTADAEVGVRDAFAAMPNGVDTGALTLNVATEVNVCNEAFAQALASASIRFRSGSAQIDPVSDGLLDDLAGIAKQCPGRLIIDGHTDSQGAAEFNQALSEDRANAVRGALMTRGLAPSSLVARGFGESQPIATNDTPEGRAQNRRITIEAARGATDAGEE